MSSPPRRRHIAADARCRAETLRDLLSLVMARTPSVRMIMGWSADQREQAEDWATREHLSASDNPVQRLIRPAFMPPDPPPSNPKET